MPYYKMSNPNIDLYHPYYSPWRYPSNWFRNIKMFFRCFKYRRQRAKYGFSKTDTCEAGYYICSVIAGILEAMSEEVRGAPDQFYDHENGSVEPWENELRRVSDLWRQVLFDLWENEWDDKTVTSEEIESTVMNACDSLREILPNLWD